MDSNYTIFRAPGITGKVLNTGSNCTFDPVSLLAVPDDPPCSCKQGTNIQAGVNGTYFVKKYCHKTFFKSFRYLFRISRPEHCLKAALNLKANGIDTPQVFAALRKQKGLLPEFDCLITEDISKEAVFANNMPLTEQLITDLCRFLAALHNAGIRHGDSNLRNIYRRNSGIWGVIDLDGCTWSSHPVSIRGRRNELARMASSFIKLINAYGIAENFPEDIPGIFAGEYEKFAGIAADSAFYRRRTAYLSQRKRK